MTVDSWYALQNEIASREALTSDEMALVRKLEEAFAEHQLTRYALGRSTPYRDKLSSQVAAGSSTVGLPAGFGEL